MTPWRRYLGLGLGVYAGTLLSAFHLEVLRGAPGWAEVQQQEPLTAVWVLRCVALPFPFVSGLMGWGFVMFLEVQGWMSASRRTQSPLPP